MKPMVGRGGLPFVRLETAWSAAEVYLQGATVTHFQRHGEAPLLFLSDKSRFESTAPIRGGIPIVFPWFGKPETRPMQHGFARLCSWVLGADGKYPDGRAFAHFTLPENSEPPSVRVEYRVTVGTNLSVELAITNFSATPIHFENCLHTYFTVGDVKQIAIRGLQGVHYLDSLAGRASKQEMADEIRFTGEVDRIYLNCPQTVEIHDPVLRRVIRVAPEQANSTVVWNPWIAKAKAMADFGDDEYLRMVCVESGNVASNAVALAADQELCLKLDLSSRALTQPDN